MRNLFKTGWMVVIGLALPLARAAAAAGESGVAEGFSTQSLFAKHRYELAFNNGVLFSPFIATHNRPTINYTLTEVQVGYMLGDVKGSGWLRGNFEALVEGFASGIFDGSGSFIAGATLWGRYNFVQPNCRLAPYAQAGAGLTSTDIDRSIVGQPFNFNLEIGVGTRYFIASHWALSLEYRYQHISNANSGRHNIGINGHGPMLGIAYLF